MNIPYETLLVTVGAGYDDISVNQTIKSTSGGIAQPSVKSHIGLQKLNPKLGLTCQVQKTTTLRAAAFRTITRSLTSNQTIEPTQVSGFNQFYDDQIGTKAVNYGLAADQVFTADLSAGMS